MATSLNTITFTNIQNLINQLNSNFAIIENSPLFKGVQGEPGVGRQGIQGTRGRSMFFINPNEISFTGINRSSIVTLFTSDAENSYANICSYLGIPDITGLYINDMILWGLTLHIFKVTAISPTPTFTDLGLYYDTPTLDIGDFKRSKTFLNSSGTYLIGDQKDDGSYVETGTDISGLHNYFGLNKKVTSNWEWHNYQNTIPSTTIIGDSCKVMSLLRTVDNNDPDFKPISTILPSLIVLQNDYNSGLLINHYGSNYLKNSAQIFKTDEYTLVIEPKMRLQDYTTARLTLKSVSNNLQDSVSESTLEYTNFTITSGKLRSGLFSTKFITNYSTNNELYIGYNPLEETIVTSSNRNIKTNKLHLVSGSLVDMEFQNPISSQAVLTNELSLLTLADPLGVTPVETTPRILNRSIGLSSKQENSTNLYTSYASRREYFKSKIITDNKDLVPRYQDVSGLCKSLWGWSSSNFVKAGSISTNYDRNFTTSFHTQDAWFQPSKSTVDVIRTASFDLDDPNLSLIYSKDLNLFSKLKIDEIFAIGRRYSPVNTSSDFDTRYVKMNYPLFIHRALPIYENHVLVYHPLVSIGNIINNRSSVESGFENPRNYIDDTITSDTYLDINWLSLRLKPTITQFTNANKSIISTNSETGYFNISYMEKNVSNIADTTFSVSSGETLINTNLNKVIGISTTETATNFTNTNYDYRKILNFNSLKYSDDNKDNIVLSGRDFNTIIDMLNILLTSLDRAGISPQLAAITDAASTTTSDLNYNPFKYIDGSAIITTGENIKFDDRIVKHINGASRT